MLTPGWLSGSFHYCGGLNVIRSEKCAYRNWNWIIHRRFFCIMIMIKWLKTYLWWINIQSCIRLLSGVWSINHSKLYANFCSLGNIFLYKVLYTPSLLQILHILIPSNTWYNRWNSQYIIDTRTRAISAHHLNTIVRTSCLLPLV